MNTRNKGETMKKRERQARRLLRVCLRQFTPECLQGYVDAYENKELADEGDLDPPTCALGAMGGKWRLYRKHYRAAQHVESIFEGWGLFSRTNLDGVAKWAWWRDVEHTARTRWIYEACVEELARRGAAKVEPEPEKVPA